MKAAFKNGHDVLFFLRKVGGNFLFSVPPIVVRPVLFLFSIIFLGRRCSCPVCGGSFSTFLPLYADRLCPRCLSFDRDRRLFFLLNRLKHLRKGPLLHCSPAVCFRLYPLPWLAPVTTVDLHRPDVDLKMDLTNSPLDDESFSVIVAQHILEHIPDDHKALQELYRLTQKGGLCLLSVPLRWGKTLEENPPPSPRERQKQYGHYDHVRLYGGEDFFDRLRDVGFQTQISFSVPEKNQILHLQEHQYASFSSLSIQGLKN